MADNSVFNTENMLGPISYGTDENVALPGDLPVDGVSNTFRWIYRKVVPCQPGDVFRVHAEARVTNDLGRLAGQTRYTVGIGWSLWYYDVDDNTGTPAAERTYQIGSPMGDNVTVDRHHMPLYITRRFKAPAGWPEGHRIVFILRADAHSTAWQVNADNDKVTVDDYGSMDILRWTSPPV